ncbi:MAG TPA: LamG domain-containing protein [Actinomycetes bacterium]|nr:LamG domain-containing protein [Actinomycetes bacterium]
MHRRLATVAAVAAVLAGLVVLAVPAHAAIDQPVATWQMNEPAGATTMLDSSGNGINGTIGAHVQIGVALSGGGTGYRFLFVQPNTPPADPDHVVVVKNNARLNPGSGTFAVELRMRTTHSFGNVIQKGQAGAAGGYWKFQQPNGKITCLFRGSAGSSTGTSGTVRVNDGLWHTVRCERTSSSVVMTVDGKVTSRNSNPTGTISNTRPMTIAGKLNCDQVNVTCDYFAGDIDYVKIQTG